MLFKERSSHGMARSGSMFLEANIPEPLNNTSHTKSGVSEEDQRACTHAQ
jgi:hypothetical protein